MKTKLESVTIVGCGTIGASWAALFAARGLNVRLYDVTAEALAAGQRKACIALEGLFKAQGEDAAELEAAKRRIRAEASPTEALSGTDFIQESVMERYEIKRTAHELIERHAPPEAIIASSSSG